MNTSLSTSPPTGRALALSGLAVALVAVTLGFLADDARAAYTAGVQSGTLTVAGNAADDTLALRLQAGVPTVLEVDVGGDGTVDFSFDRGTFTAINVDAGDGNDVVRIDQSAGAFSDEAVTLNGGDGNDTLLGGAGAEALFGGRGDDVVAGGDGNDVAFLGGGDDRFRWNPGDDSDVVEGDEGNDLLDFFGSAIAENVDVSANDSRVRFTRDVALVAMDLAGVERVGFHAFGGADTVVVDDLTGTGVTTAEIDLDGPGGGGDAEIDTVVAKGTDGADQVVVGSSADAVHVSGLSAQVQVTGAEAAYDDVNVATLGGEDTITSGIGVAGPASINADGGDAADTVRFDGTGGADQIDVVANGAEVSTVAAGTTRLDSIAVESLIVRGGNGADTISSVGNLAPLTALTLDGGDGNDVLGGGNGADLLLGGSGDDTVDGGPNADRALLGGGDDRFQWTPGDGDDTVEGSSGRDLVDFFGSNIAENIDVFAGGSGVRLTRDIGLVDMDIDSVESILVHVFGGADTIEVGDLTGTDVGSVDIDLALFGGGNDAQPDTVVTDGTARKDAVDISRLGSDVQVSGLAAKVRIGGGEGAIDTLRVQTLGGNDSVRFVSNVNDLVSAIVDLGADE